MIRIMQNLQLAMTWLAVTSFLGNCVPYLSSGSISNMISDLHRPHQARAPFWSFSRNIIETNLMVNEIFWVTKNVISVLSLTYTTVHKLARKFGSQQLHSTKYFCTNEIFRSLLGKRFSFSFLPLDATAHNETVKSFSFGVPWQRSFSNFFITSYVPTENYISCDVRAGQNYNSLHSYAYICQQPSSWSFLSRSYLHRICSQIRVEKERLLSSNRRFNRKQSF